MISRAALALVVAVTALASAGSAVSGGEPTVDVRGDGAELVGVASADAARVSVVLADGSERELALDEGRGFAYRAAAPDHAATVLLARDTRGSVVATVRLAPPASCGGRLGPCDASASPERSVLGFLMRRERTELARIDPRTLRPLGRTVRLAGPVAAHAVSPSGDRVAFGSSRAGSIRIADRDLARVSAPIRLVAGEEVEVRVLAWLATDRIVAVVQRLGDYRRRVRLRELVVVDPSAGRVVARRRITNRLAIGGSQVAAGRLVLLLYPSTWSGDRVTLVVADANGAVRTTAVTVGRSGSALQRPALAVEPDGRRAILLRWGLRETLPAIAVALDTRRVTTQRLRVTGAPLRPATISTLWASSVGPHHVATFGVVATGARPAAGVHLLDTRSWTVRQLDGEASSFAAHQGRVLAFGSNSAGGTAGARGVGVRAYDLTGRRLYHLYGSRPLGRVLFAGDYGHVIRGRAARRLVFDARTGRALGTLPPLAAEVAIVEEPPRRETRDPFVAAQPTDPFARISNRGTPIELSARTRRDFRRSGMPSSPAFLLGTRAGIAFYRIGPDSRPCYFTGNASEPGVPGSGGCGGLFPSRRFPVLDHSTFALRRGETAPRLIRIAGIAADAVVEFGIRDRRGRVVERVPVVENLFADAAPPQTPVGSVVGFDAGGRIVYRHSLFRRRPLPPRPTTTRPRPAPQPRPAPGERAIQRGAADGASVEVYRSGLVIFRLLARDSRAGRLLSGTTVSAGCIKLERFQGHVDPWEVLHWKPFRPDLRVVIAGRHGSPKPPFDACEIRGSYGRRWGTPYGYRSAVEIPFNLRARRFFADRAEARRLAYFVRSPALTAIRRALKQGAGPAPSSAAIAGRYPAGVVALAARTDRPPTGAIGVWSDANEIIEAVARGAGGRRLFVTIRAGRIARHNVEGLAFVF